VAFCDGLRRLAASGGWQLSGRIATTAARQQLVWWPLIFAGSRVIIVVRIVRVVRIIKIVILPVTDLEVLTC